jgi:cellobiose-specific phosphotransferase system component IIC
MVVGKISHLFSSWWGSGLAWDIITAIPFILVDMILAVIFYTNYSLGVVM